MLLPWTDSLHTPPTATAMDRLPPHTPSRYCHGPTPSTHTPNCYCQLLQLHCSFSLFTRVFVVTTTFFTSDKRFVLGNIYRRGLENSTTASRWSQIRPPSPQHPWEFFMLPQSTLYAYLQVPWTIYKTICLVCHGNIKMNLRKWAVKMWMEFNWPRIRPSDGLIWYNLGIAKTDTSWSCVWPSASEEYLSCNVQLHSSDSGPAFSSPTLLEYRRILHSFVKDLPLRQRKWWIGLSAGTGCTISRTEICEIAAT